LTDPYVYNGASGIVNAQYGKLISWPWPVGNRAVEYSGSGNVAISAELEVLSVEPANATIDSTLKIMLSNYSGQQPVNPTCDCNSVIRQGDTQVVTVSNIANDYFSIALLMDGAWSNATLNLRVYGTDKGNESFIIRASNSPFLYNIPTDTSGISYFKTNGTYRAVRLDAIWNVWKGYSVNGNIASSEIIETNNTGGWISSNTCSAPDAMCHINQEATFIGMSDGLNPNKSLYSHNMEAVTAKQCKTCHLRYQYGLEIPMNVSPVPGFVPGGGSSSTHIPTSTPIPTITATPIPTITPIPTSTPIPTITPTPTSTATPPPTPSIVSVAGFRSSDYGGPLNGNQYGHDQVDPAYWVSVAQRMQAKFPGSSPGAQYVVGYIETPETNTYMPFPAPAGYEGMPNVDFGPTGVEEQMLTAFDAAGMKIILQVEPGDADVPRLATMILNKFKQHPSVVGFGVDVEWLRWMGSNQMGSKTNDTEIQTWLNAVHAINPTYKLLIKHWDPTWLGSGHVPGVTYITDSLNHGSYNAAITDYVSWANHFSGSEIGYQIGYEEDMSWWLPMADPATTIIADIKTQVPTANIYSVYWVDFAITKEFPVI
jgi:hypothetical protein